MLLDIKHVFTLTWVIGNVASEYPIQVEPTKIGPRNFFKQTVASLPQRQHNIIGFH